MNNHVRIFVRLFWQSYLMLLTKYALNHLLDEIEAILQREDL